MSAFITALQAFTDPDDEAQLRALDLAVQKLSPESASAAELRAGFEVFERFAQHDGDGVFWALLHALEACPGCAHELIASVQRQPAEFNVLMLNRLLNGDVYTVDGVAVLDVLRAVPQHPLVSVNVAGDAVRYLRHQASSTDSGLP